MVSCCNHLCPAAHCVPLQTLCPAATLCTAASIVSQTCARCFNPLQVDVIRTVTLPLLRRFGVEDGLELKVRRA